MKTSNILLFPISAGERAPMIQRFKRATERAQAESCIAQGLQFVTAINLLSEWPVNNATTTTNAQRRANSPA